jgi:hypothetical protein
MVIKALRAAIDSNTDIREEQYNYNLIVCPGYPELIPNLVTLNKDRNETAFIIGDTPLDLTPTSTQVTQWERIFRSIWSRIPRRVLSTWIDQRYQW